MLGTNNSQPVGSALASLQMPCLLSDLPCAALLLPQIRAAAACHSVCVEPQQHGPAVLPGGAHCGSGHPLAQVRGICQLYIISSSTAVLIGDCAIGADGVGAENRVVIACRQSCRTASTGQKRA
jgi:hypothetical protein